MLLTIKAGDTTSSSVVTQNDAAKTNKNEDTLKERPSRKNRKKEKEHVEKTSIKSQIKKRLLVLPLEASVAAIFLLVLLGAFYVVCKHLLSLSCLILVVYPCYILLGAIYKVLICLSKRYLPQFALFSPQ